MTLQSGRATEFEKHRAKLWRIAYRMLGSQDEAEDTVQEAYLRWHSIRTPQAWLVATVEVNPEATRTCCRRSPKPLAIVAINGWNRVSIAFRAEAGSYQVPDKAARGVA